MPLPKSIVTNLFAIYLVLYCISNRYNCVRNRGINLPLGYINIIGPFKHIFTGRAGLGLKMLFSFNTPYLFIILSLIYTVYQINKSKKEEKKNN